MRCLITTLFSMQEKRNVGFILEACHKEKECTCISDIPKDTMKATTMKNDFLTSRTEASIVLYIHVHM